MDTFMEIEEKVVFGKPSFTISNRNIELSVTRQGGQMAPVVFYKDSENPVKPYFISPWQTEPEEPEEPNLKPLRGDFFCMPCGLPKAFREEGFMVHGETATGNWQFEDFSNEDGLQTLALRMNTNLRKGSVRKTLSIREGSNAIYIRHELSGYQGSFSFGHHAILAVPKENGSLIYSSSPFQFGYTQPRNPSEFGNNGEYFFLDSGKKFSSLKKVPTIWKEQPEIDCTDYPTAAGFGGLVQFYNNQNSTPAWSAAYFPKENYVWFALKDARILPATVLWIENKSRHGHPWNGRTCCLGIEDNCVAIGDDEFNLGLRQDLERNSICFEHCLEPEQVVRVSHIQGVQRVPDDFGQIENIIFNENSITLVSQSGKMTEADVEWKFIYNQ